MGPMTQGEEERQPTQFGLFHCTLRPVTFPLARVESSSYCFAHAEKVLVGEART